MFDLTNPPIVRCQTPPKRKLIKFVLLDPLVFFGLVYSGSSPQINFLYMRQISAPGDVSREAGVADVAPPGVPDLR